VNTADSGQSMTCTLVVIKITLCIKSAVPTLHTFSQHDERPTNKQRLTRCWPHPPGLLSPQD